MLYYEEVKNMVQDVGSLWRVEWREITNAFIDDTIKKSNEEILKN